MQHGEAALRFALEPLAEAMAHPATSEVVINQPGCYLVEQDGYWHAHDAPALDLDRLEAIAHLAAYRTGKTISTASPSVASVLPDGHRIKSSIPPATEPGTISHTIRKRATHFTPTLGWLDEHGYFELLDETRDWPSYFARWMDGSFAAERSDQRNSIIITGEIGSSKTTFAEALLFAVPQTMRLVTIEGSPEWLKFPHRNWLKYYFDEAKLETAVARVQDTMQQRPDWAPFQELRGAEAFALARLLKTGTRSLFTIHAPSAGDALASVEGMIRQHPQGSTMPRADIYADIRRYVGLVCHTRRFLPGEHEGNTRTLYRLVQVLELGSDADADRWIARA